MSFSLWHRGESVIFSYTPALIMKVCADTVMQLCPVVKSNSSFNVFLKNSLTSSRIRATADQVIKLFHSLFNTSRSKAIGILQRKQTNALLRVTCFGKVGVGNILLTKTHFSLWNYPIRAENGHPTMAPAATPMMANGVESWNQPVMATRVVYMQKDEGRNAEEREREKKRRMDHKKRICDRNMSQSRYVTSAKF